MLILTRRLFEGIVINDETKITILGIKGNQICLGIEAPLHIPVDRQGIHLRKKKNYKKVVI